MQTRTLPDQLGNPITFSFPPGRIISLVPSQTELLFDLGYGDQVAGITKFCVHPRHAAGSKTIIGGTKNFRFDVIDSLAPDLIIGNKEENYLEGVDQLRKKYPLWMSDVGTFEEALQLIHSFGTITGREDKSHSLVREIELAFDQLKRRNLARAMYMIWQNPWMGAGRDTFINSMMHKAGFSNVLERHNRYPILTAGEIQELNPSVVLLPTEPFPFGQRHAYEIKELLPDVKTFLVDGEMFSWYGSRMRLAPAYFQKLQPPVG